MNILSFLSSPTMYTLAQRITGGENARRYALGEFMKVAPGARVVDIGCGTARSLEYLPAVTYFGFEPSDPYTRYARIKYGANATFVCGYFETASARALKPYDVVLLLGVLHHCDDATASKILSDSYEGLAAAGRVLILDPCLTSTQSLMARKIALSDRGKFVRTPEQYRALASPYFSVAKSEIRDGVLRIPTTIHAAELTPIR